MSRSTFDKKPLTPEQMVEKLQARGLQVRSPRFVVHCLKSVGYYRLSAYFASFYQGSAHPHLFRVGTTFDAVWHLYTFDKALRLLVADPLETIEVALRASLTDVMSVQYGAHWYVQPQHFVSNEFFRLFSSKIAQICRNSEEVFLKHYYKKYTDPNEPPGWMIMECLPFGTCVKILNNIRSLADRRAICEVFDGHPTIISSWLGALCYTRNLCAHHARLWNRWFVVRPKQSHQKPFDCQPRTFCEQAYVLLHLLKSLDPGRALAWKSELFDLFEKFTEVDKQKMGFRADWRQDPVWDH